MANRGSCKKNEEMIIYLIRFSIKIIQWLCHKGIFSGPDRNFLQYSLLKGSIISWVSLFIVGARFLLEESFVCIFKPLQLSHVKILGFETTFIFSSKFYKGYFSQNAQVWVYVHLGINFSKFRINLSRASVSRILDRKQALSSPEHFKCLT